MAEIVEFDDRYRVYFFREAQPVPKPMLEKARKQFKETVTKRGFIVEDKWDENGYIVWIGVINNEFVPYFTDYDKTVYSEEMVKKYASNIAKCGHCVELNEAVGIVKKVDDERYKVTDLEVGSVSVEDKPKKSKVKDLLGSMWLDLHLTPGGKAFLAMVLDEDDLIRLK